MQQGRAPLRNRIGQINLSSWFVVLERILVQLAYVKALLT